MSEVQAQAAEVQKPLINILKVASGEEIVAEVRIEQLEAGQEIIHLVNPFAIVRQIGENNQLTIGIVPLADLTSTGSVQISTSQIVYTAAPSADFEKHYLDKVNPPLVQAPPEKKLIVPGA